jgi:formylglycine-generating enzyme required for sulfatase activity
MEFSLVERTPLSIDIDKGVSNLSDREAMGLPSYYESSTIDKEVQEWYGELIDYTPEKLAVIAENEDVEFSKRYAAGNLLNIKGDPRILATEPKMIDIPAWDGMLGLKETDIDTVVSEYEALGILRNWIEKESPQYKVSIESFRIGKYPVTNKEFLEFLVDTKYEEIPNSWKFGQYPHWLSNHPVYTVSEQAAIDYCNWLSEKTGRTFRLPTEAEWEYAAAGKEELEFPWGETFKSDRANTVETGILQTTPVGIFPKGSSPFGCADMAGNVEEYVEDFYGNYGVDESHDPGTPDDAQRRGSQREPRCPRPRRFPRP